jgi:hypothetical protein
LQSIWNRFFWLFVFAISTVVLIFGATLFPVTETVTKERLREAAAPALERVSTAGLPTGFQFEKNPNFRLELQEDRIFLYAAFTGDVLGNYETNIEFVATGYPAYVGNGAGAIGRTVVTLYELVTGSRTEKRIVFRFTNFDIVDETFTVDGEPAVEFAIPGGQAVVGAAAETTAGRFVTGVLDRMGRDTSDEARDAWTARTMRENESLLIAWFENIVQGQVNNRTIYRAGDSAYEQLAAASFGGFDIDPDAVTLRFYVAALLAGLVSIAFGTLFGIGYWFKKILFVGKDQDLVDLDDKTIEGIGDAAQGADDLRKL